MSCKTVKNMKHVFKSYCEFCGHNFSENSILCVKCSGIQKCDLCNGKQKLKYFYRTGTIYCKECERTNICGECDFVHDKPEYLVIPCVGKCW